ncbi:hypothetical protein D2Q93_08310 [Alicyclobacillaceae bacterium I2511]|nr:hypothetical protein D2Q93_08310 [Alicyclobacillaceae bacterium I2511]
MGLWRGFENVYSLRLSEVQPVRDVFRITTQNGSVLCLKPFDYNQQEMQFIAMAMEYLKKSGFPYIPKILRTKEGFLWARIKQRKYMLTDWIRGRSPNFSNLDEYGQAVQTLARFHKHSEGFVCSDGITCRRKVEKLENGIRQTRHVLQQTGSIPSDTRALLLDFCDLAQSRLQEPTVQDGIRHETAHGALAHGDFNYPNLVRNTRGHLYVIDFDAVAYQVRMVDLAHLLQRNCGWSGEKVLRWLDVYNRVRPLSGEDCALLTMLLYTPHTVARQIRLHRHRHLSVVRQWPSVQTLRLYSRHLDQIMSIP